MTLEMYFYIVGTKMFSRSHPGIGFSEYGTQARFCFPVTMVAEHAVQPAEYVERHGSDGGAEVDNGQPSSSPRRRHLVTPVGAAAEGWAPFSR